MDIRQLNYFIQVADCGNYSLASQKLFVSQPALSKTIKNMEEELGFEFFYTYQRKQMLTDAGQSFYEKAVELLKQYNALMEMTYDEAGIDKGHINIGLSTAAGPALFGHIYPAFISEYPLIDFSLTERDTNILKEDILRKDIDMAIIDLRHMREDEMDTYEIYELVQSDLVVVTSVDNPFAKYDSISYADLDGNDLILYVNSSVGSDQMAHDLKNSNSKPNVVFSSSQWYLTFEMVAANIGSVIAPYYIFNKLKNPKITAVPMEGESGRRTIALITKRGENISRACRTFIDFATNTDLYEDLESCLKIQ